MIFGMSGKPCPANFPFAGAINAQSPDVPPLLVAAIAWRETLSIMSPADALVCVSGDGGHGICQLTASYPDPGWNDALGNISYAVDNFLKPAIAYWHGLEQQVGDRLVKLVSATFNEGLSAAIKYHALGNVDLGDTNNYGQGVLDIYDSLVATGSPT